MLRAVHFVIDSQQADRLRATPGRHMLACRWSSWIVPAGACPSVPPNLVRHEAELPGAEVTVILPRHSIATPSSGRNGWGARRHGGPDRPRAGPGARRRGD